MAAELTALAAVIDEPYVAPIERPAVTDADLMAYVDLPRPRTRAD